jgi:hypothetical protein
MRRIGCQLNDEWLATRMQVTWRLAVISTGTKVCYDFRSYRYSPHVTIGIIVTLIVQLDYPFRGYISVSDEPFEHALSRLEAPGAVH